MSYLLDTNVVSALRKPDRNPRVRAWAVWISPAQLFVAAHTIAEIERRVVAKERTDPAQGGVLRRWFEDRVLPTFEGRVLPFDLPAARILASYRVPEHAPFADAVIAAVAQSADKMVVSQWHLAPTQPRDDIGNGIVPVRGDFGDDLMHERSCAGQINQVRHEVIRILQQDVVTREELRWKTPPISGDDRLGSGFDRGCGCPGQDVPHHPREQHAGVVDRNESQGQSSSHSAARRVISRAASRVAARWCVR